MTGRPITFCGIEIRQFDVPCTPYVWTHDETNGHGTAETIEEAMAQIERHLDRRNQADGKC